MAVTLRNSTAIAAFALSAAVTGAQAQHFEPWVGAPVVITVTPSAPRYYAPSIVELCKSPSTTPLKVFPNAKEAFRQENGYACKYRFGLNSHTPLFSKAYRLDQESSINAFIKDVERAESKETRAIAKEQRERADRYEDRPRHDSGRRPHRRDRDHDASPHKPRAHGSAALRGEGASGGPIRGHETFEQGRARRLQEKGYSLK